MSDWNDRDKDKEPKEIVIQDRRHLRDLEAEAEEAAPEPEPEPEPAPEPEPPAPVEEEPAPGEVVEFQRPQRPPEEPTPAPEAPPQQGPPESPEEAQMRMLFEIGINGYLHGQIQLLLTFALIYLGRQPNPATGLVTADLDKARTAIDLLEFIAARTLGDLPPEEQASLRQLVGELKMVFSETAQAQATPPQEPAPE